MRSSQLELRKLQRTPDGTFLVTIPKAWAKRVGLGAGSVVSYEERQDGRLLLSPKIDEERAPLEVVLDASPFVRREIIERYLLGYDIIRVQSKDSFSPDIREEVRRTTKRLVGAAISDTYLLEKIKVSSVDCLDFRLLASYIETFADYAVTIAENTQGGVTIPKEEQALLEKIGASVNAMYRDAVGSVLSRDLKLASSVGPRFKDAKKQLSEAEARVAGSARPLVNHLVAVTIALNRMCEISVDISDLTITR